MSRKISEYFKVTPKVQNSANCGKNFLICENKLTLKVRECRVIIKDIKSQLDDNLKLFDEISLNKQQKNEIKKFRNKIVKTTCKICNKKLLSEANLKKHLNTVHSFQQYECDFDGNIFNSKEGLRNHMKVHYRLIECEICYKILKPTSMYIHMKTHEIRESFHQCRICSKTFKTAYYLAVHEKIHNKKFKCQICHKLFPIKSNLDRHIKEYHDNPKSFECGICGTKFSQKNILTFHQKTHDKNRQKAFRCHRCDYATDNTSHFKNHQNFHDRQDKKYAAMKNPLKCQKCPTFHRNVKMLKQHLNQVHPKNLFQCDLCAKFFKIRNHLLGHVKIHILKS